MNNIFAIFLSLLSLSLYTSVLALDKCPTPDLKKDFNLTEYLGEWYEIQYYPKEFQEGFTCVKAKYTLGENSIVDMEISGLDSTAHKQVIEAKAIQNKDNPANFSVDYTNSGNYTGQYWVIETDYTQHSLVYSCKEINGTVSESAWILSRNSTLQDDVIKTLTKALNETGSDITLFRVTDQSKCGAAQTTLSLSLIGLIYFILKITV